MLEGINHQMQVMQPTMLTKCFLAAVTHIHKPILILVSLVDGVHKTSCT